MNNYYSFKSICQNAVANRSNEEIARSHQIQEEEEDQLNKKNQDVVQKEADDATMAPVPDTITKVEGKNYLNNINNFLKFV